MTYSNLPRTTLQLPLSFAVSLTTTTIMSLRRIKVQASRYFTRRGSCILFVILIWFLFYHLPAPPSTQNNTRADRPPPEHRVEDTARFIYRSPFRNDPNVQYEQQLSNALEEIEKAVLTQSEESNISKDRIWQIAKSQKDRGEDSIVFKGKNKDWIYTVSTLAGSLLDFD